MDDNEDETSKPPEHPFEKRFKAIEAELEALRERLATVSRVAHSAAGLPHPR